MTNMPNSSGIYIIRNSINENVYVGQSAYLSDRIKWHIRELKKGNHPNPKLQRFVDKYGIRVLSFGVLELLDKNKELLCEREQFHMDKHLIKFNISKSAYSTLGVKKTSDERMRMSITRKGKKQTPEQIEAAAKPKRGVKRAPFSEETKRKISMAARERNMATFKGRKHTDESKEKLRQHRLGKKMSSDFVEKMKLVTRGEKNGMFGKRHSEETKEKIRAKKLERDRILNE
jgi:group I intron endonuclease